MRTTSKAHGSGTAVAAGGWKMMDQVCGEPVAPDPAGLARVPMLSERARGVASDALATKRSTADLLRSLIGQGLDLDALRIAPFVLPIRQAVWWGCLWAWHATGPAPQEAEEKSIAASVRWVQQPTAKHVAAAEASWPAASLQSPAGCCARATSLAGFLLDERSGIVSGQPLGAAKMLAGGAMVAVESAKERQIAASPMQLVTFAIDVAQNAVPWTPA